MDAKARILAIHLMETIQKDPRYAKSLGIEAALKRKNRAFHAPVSPY